MKHPQPHIVHTLSMWMYLWSRGHATNSGLSVHGTITASVIWRKFHTWSTDKSDADRKWIFDRMSVLCYQVVATFSYLDLYQIKMLNPSLPPCLFALTTNHHTHIFRSSSRPCLLVHIIYHSTSGPVEKSRPNFLCHPTITPTHAQHPHIVMKDGTSPLSGLQLMHTHTHTHQSWQNTWNNTTHRYSPVDKAVAFLRSQDNQTTIGWTVALC